MAEEYLSEKNFGRLAAIVGIGSLAAGFYRGYSDSCGLNVALEYLPIAIGASAGTIGFYSHCGKPPLIEDLGVICLGFGAVGGGALAIMCESIGYFSGMTVKNLQ